jgi:hypothetical protein
MLIKLYGLNCDSCGSRGASGFPTAAAARGYATRYNGYVRVPAKGGAPARDVCSRCTKRASE